MIDRRWQSTRFGSLLSLHQPGDAGQTSACPVHLELVGLSRVVGAVELDPQAAAFCELPWQVAGESRDESVARRSGGRYEADRSIGEHVDLPGGGLLAAFLCQYFGPTVWQDGIAGNSHSAPVPCIRDGFERAPLLPTLTGSGELPGRRSIEVLLHRAQSVPVEVAEKEPRE